MVKGRTRAVDFELLNAKEEDGGDQSVSQSVSQISLSDRELFDAKEEDGGDHGGREQCDVVPRRVEALPQAYQRMIQEGAH